MSKDMALEVSKRRCKNNMEQIFSIESAFVKITLLRWFNKKFKISVWQNQFISKIKIWKSTSNKLENWQMCNL